MIWTPRVTVAAVVRQNDQYLLVEEHASGQTVLNQPAGHLEDGESLVEAVKREVLEETARHFEPSGLIAIYRYPLPEKNRTYLRFCFAGSVGEPVPGLALDPDITDTHWIGLAQIKNRQDQLRSPMVIQCIEDFLCKPLLPLDTLHDVL